ncbi:hypothetical protein EO244_11005 [Ancylomarina salipaludis]|uniref:Uncharacterized protein n=1 Tax=Ancylomarina salipaludis TaxID=2501299 RepID=A0A4Q1JLG6_9BACT|nr:hypothetical protein [Ancylomarina salipaludis]RXQ92992.1 hypothetical protein EO244_11005 [Ancylomarina salipaludis]
MTKSIYFFIIVIFSLSLIGCDKENEDVQTPEPNKTKFELLLEEYNLLDSDVNFENYTLGIDTNLIYFNGRKKDQLFIECFNRTDKSNVLSWNKQAAIDTIVTVDKGYGETATYTFENFKLRQAYTYKNNHVFILQGGYAENLLSTYSLDLFFVSNQDYTKIKKIRMGALIQNLFYIIPWYEGHILYQTSDEEGETVCISYTVNGEEIYKAEDSININEENIIPINLYEYIGFVNNSFYRNNLTTKNRIWISENVLPDNSRVDDAEITQEDPDYVIFDLKYTLYSGDKKSKKFKVNIESGTFTEI